MDFYAVLPSNASPEVYPQNITSNFKVQLSERMDLHGKWQVALFEIHYPNTLSQVQDGNNWIKVYRPYVIEPVRVRAVRAEKGPVHDVIDVQEANNETPSIFTLEEKFTIRTGAYTTARELVNEVQTGLDKMSIIPETQKRTFLVRETSEGRAHFQPFRACLDASYVMARSLSLQLGLTHPGPHKADRELIGVRPIDVSLGVPSQMYIYLNIIQDQIVGHTRAPLLRTVPTVIDSKHGSISTYRCEHPVYFDLNTKSFDNIEVNIRTDTGDFMPFSHGTLTLLVHFKRHS